MGYNCYFQSRALQQTLAAAKDALLDAVVNTMAPGEEPIVVQTGSSMVQVQYSPWASCQIRKLRDVHAPGMPGTFSVCNPDMHHGTCLTHVPRCMPVSLTSGILWSRLLGKRSQHSRPMRNPQLYVSGKRPMMSMLSTSCFIGDKQLFSYRQPRTPSDMCVSGLGCCLNIWYSSSETYIGSQNCRDPFVHNLLLKWQIVLKFCAERGSDTAVWHTATMKERDFARSEFEMRFWRITYIATGPRVDKNGA